MAGQSYVSAEKQINLSVNLGISFIYIDKRGPSVRSSRESIFQIPVRPKSMLNYYYYLRKL